MGKKNTEIEERKRQELFKIKRLELHPDTEKIIKNACHEFSGNGTTLESALGALFIGQIHGWRVLRLMHGSTTYNNYEKILNIKFKDYCLPEGIFCDRSWGYRLTRKIESFWKVATGKVKTEGKNKLLDDGVEIPTISK